MADLLLLAADLTITFGIAGAAAYAVGKIRSLRHGVRPYPGCRVRLRGKSQIYRCRLEFVDGDRWQLSPPLVRDKFFPLEPGAKLTGEVVLGSGNLLFKSQVSFSDKYKGRLWINAPKRTYWKEFASLKSERSPRPFERGHSDHPAACALGFPRGKDDMLRTYGEDRKNAVPNPALLLL